eukprot:589379-Rhodomonas_salina.1
MRGSGWSSSTALSQVKSAISLPGWYANLGIETALGATRQQPQSRPAARNPEPLPNGGQWHVDRPI